MNRFTISVPKEFDFQLSMEFLPRSPEELLYRVKENRAVKLVKIGEKNVLFECLWRCYRKQRLVGVKFAACSVRPEF